MLKRCRPLLGTFVEITATREEGIEAAFDAVSRVHRLMSAHDPSSDLARINCFAHLRAVVVEGWTAQVLERALYWAKQSGGAFDPVRAGAAGLRSGLVVRHQNQPAPLASDWRSIELRGRSVRLASAACLDLGGIAKGFAVDRAIDALRSSGCPGGLVNAGGDLRAFGSEPWPVDIVDPLTRSPRARIELGNAALATSGGVPNGDTLRFDHLGAVRRWTSVSVLAPTACDADALTKLVWLGCARMEAILAESCAKALGIVNHQVEAIGARELAA